MYKKRNCLGMLFAKIRLCLFSPHKVELISPQTELIIFGVSADSHHLHPSSAMLFTTFDMYVCMKLHLPLYTRSYRDLLNVCILFSNRLTFMMFISKQLSFPRDSGITCVSYSFYLRTPCSGLFQEENVGSDKCI